MVVKYYLIIYRVRNSFMKFSHALMHNNFTKSDMIAASKLFKGKNIVLTQSKQVKKLWSKIQ